MTRTGWVTITAVLICAGQHVWANENAIEPSMGFSLSAPDPDTSALAPLPENWLDRRLKEPSAHLVDNNAHDHELFNQPEKAEPIASPFASADIPPAPPLK